MSKTFAALVATVTLTATAATAAAESYDAAQSVKPSQGYLGVGGTLGAQRAIVGGMYIDGGKRIGGSPLFVHGQLTGGKSGTDGSFAQLRAGAEARGCVFNGLFCAFAGADAGYQRDHMIDEGWFGNPDTEIDAHDLLLVPRAGVEAGGKIKARAMLETPLYYRVNGVEMETRTGGGIAASFAVAAVF
jgi:hypothetical protein